MGAKGDRGDSGPQVSVYVVNEWFCREHKHKNLVNERTCFAFFNYFSPFYINVVYNADSRREN